MSPILAINNYDVCKVICHSNGSDYHSIKFCELLIDLAKLIQYRMCYPFAVILMAVLLDYHTAPPYQNDVKVFMVTLSYVRMATVIKTAPRCLC